MTTTATKTSPSLDSFEEYAKLHRERQDLEDQAKAIGRKMAAMQESLMERMMEAGVRNVKLATNDVVFIERRVTAVVKRDGDKATEGERQRAVRAMMGLGLWDIVTLNSQSLSRYVREHQDLPPEIEAVIQTDEIYKLKVRRG